MVCRASIVIYRRPKIKKEANEQEVLEMAGRGRGVSNLPAWMQNQGVATPSQGPEPAQPPDQQSQQQPPPMVSE